MFCLPIASGNENRVRGWQYRFNPWLTKNTGNERTFFPRKMGFLVPGAVRHVSGAPFTCLRNGQTKMKKGKVAWV